MENLNLVELQTKTAAVVADFEQNQAAIMSEHAAAVELLRKVVAIVRPAIRSIGDSPIISDESRAGQAGDKQLRYSGRVLSVTGEVIKANRRGGQRGDTDGEYDGGYSAINESGEIVEFVYSGGWSLYSGSLCAYSCKIRPVNLSTIPTDRIVMWIGDICTAVDAANPRVKSTAAARVRAEKLNAIAALL